MVYLRCKMSLWINIIIKYHVRLLLRVSSEQHGNYSRTTWWLVDAAVSLHKTLYYIALHYCKHTRDLQGPIDPGIMGLALKVLQIGLIIIVMVENCEYSRPPTQPSNGVRFTYLYSGTNHLNILTLLLAVLPLHGVTKLWIQCLRKRPWRSRKFPRIRLYCFSIYCVVFVAVFVICHRWLRLNCRYYIIPHPWGLCWAYDVLS